MPSPSFRLPLHRAARLAAMVTLSGGASMALTQAPIPYATSHTILPGDSSEVIAEKAGKVLPRPNQSAWMRLERTFFIHFGPNTFRGVEWGTGREDPAIFNPTQLNADQWMDAIQAAGGKMVVLVAKHHDGFCMWPSRYTQHSVASSPWKSGKGDVVKEVANAARKRGIKLAVYLSPADLYQLRTNPTNPKGYYGNESAKRLSAIPTDPAQFQTKPSEGRPAPKGRETYHYVVDDYNRYFLNQLYETLTEYGPIDEVWFDGANPDPSVHETYDHAAWYDLIRKLQPNAVIFGKGPDARWVGNEEGVGRETEWSVVPLPMPPDQFTWPDMYGDLGTRAQLKPGSTLWWFPAEVNTPILYGWFWAEGKPVKPATELIDYFYRSVGRNGNMLLNLSPDNRGLIPDNQLAALSQMGQVINATFATDLAKGARLEADTAAEGHPANRALDGSLDTWWEAAPGQRSATLTLTLPKPTTFDVISLQEAVDTRSQRIETFSVDAWVGNEWVTLDTQTTVGYRRILRTKAPITSNQVRIRITGSRLEPTLAKVGLFKQAVSVPAPEITDRDANGRVSLTADAGEKVVFTLDGTMPTAKSPIYREPIDLRDGGTLQAAVLTGKGELGAIATKTFVGAAPIGWKVVGEAAGASAIDGNPASAWVDEKATSLTVDMGSARRISGFAYLPPRSKELVGVIEAYRFEVSLDGMAWTPVREGGFGNIRNNPAQQQEFFAPVSARFFRLTSLREVNGKGGFAAREVSVIPARESR